MVTDEHIVYNPAKISLMRVSSGKVRNISGVNQGFFLKKDLIENIIYLNIKAAYHSFLNLL